MQNKETYQINGYLIECYRYLNIFIVSNFLQNNECDNLIDAIDTGDCVRLEKTETNNVECFKSTIKDNTLSLFVKDKFTDIANVLADIKKIPITELTNPEYRKVYGETHYHADGTCVDTVIDPNRLCKTKQVRSLTMVCALNNDFNCGNSDVKGGLHKFPELDFEINLGKGCLIAFPPYWTHKHLVTAVEPGKYRYILSCWALDKYLCKDVEHGNIIMLK
jgi:hypothetical protein